MSFISHIVIRGLKKMTAANPAPMNGRLRLPSKEI
jgi:hypothetical protein